MIVNGVTLPDIPADVLAQYRYLTLVGTIGTNSQGTMSAYILQASNSKFAVVPPGMQMLDDESYTYNTLVWTEKSGAAFLYMAGMYDSWTEDANYIGSTSPVDCTMDLTEINGTVQEFDLLATNHDICIATAYDIATQTPTVGTEVYCTATAGFPPGVEPSPTRYSIAKAILDGVARQIMRLTDSTAKVKPEEFEPKLEGINIQLQELTVVATEEVQTITPPSGVYGFSKVIVEAVEDSGSTGGGGTPGEGGDDSGGETFASAENVSFGTEQVEKETGRYLYGDLGALPPFPSEYEYQVVSYREYNNIGILAVQSELTFYGSGTSLKRNYTTKYVTYRYDETAGAWTEYARGTSKNISVGAVKWSNYVIYESDGTTIFFSGSEAVAEKEIVEESVAADETYTIEGETLNSLVGVAQDITGITDPMTPTEAIKALEAYYNTTKPEPTE